jgi:outer membrane lipoprotein LolB
VINSVTTRLLKCLAAGLFSLSVAFTGSGCQTNAAQTGTDDGIAKKPGNAQQVAAATNAAPWDVRASLGIWTEQTSTTAKQNITASMQWSEAQDLRNVTLRGPLGVGELVLTEAKNTARLQRGTSVLTGRDGSRLVQQALNLVVPVPLDELSSWIRGLPGAATDVTYDNEGRVQSLRYADKAGVPWQAMVQRYTKAGDVELPTLITAKGGPYNVRLVLRDWQLGKPNSDIKPATNDSKGRLNIPEKSG